MKVPNGTETLEIDRPNKRVRSRVLATGEEFWASYDKLVLATGASPFIPKIPGVNSRNVFTLHGVHDAEGIKGILAEHLAKDVVIIGGGLIGVEATEAGAKSLGFDVVTAAVPGPDKAHYMPTSKPLLMKMVADKKTGRLLGVQATGPGEGAKRIDVAATAITAGMTLDDVADLDRSYAPPYAPAMDNLITAANVARNKRDGYMVGISAESVQRKLQSGEDFVFLDVRSPQEHAQVRLPKSMLIPLGALRKKLSESPKDKEIITFCAISLRGYEASLILRAAGFTNVKVLDGGVAMWPYEKEM